MLSSTTKNSKRFHDLFILDNPDMTPDDQVASLESKLAILSSEISDDEGLAPLPTPPRVWLSNLVPSPTSSISSASSSSSISTALSFTQADDMEYTGPNNNNSNGSVRHSKRLRMDSRGRSKRVSPLITDLAYRQTASIDSPIEASSPMRFPRSFTPPGTPSSPALSSSESCASYVSASSSSLMDLPFGDCNLYNESFVPEVGPIQEMEFELEDGVSLTRCDGDDETKCFPNTCPEDILLCIFRHLDDDTLSKAYRVSRSWRDLITHYENWLWSHLSRRDWHHTEKTEAAVNWRHHYYTHKNLHRGNYRFQSFNMNTVLPDNFGYKPEDTTVTSPQSTRRNYVMAWPVDPTDAYIVALAGDQVCWVDVATPDVIHIVKVEPMEAEQVEASQGVNDVVQDFIEILNQPLVNEMGSPTATLTTEDDDDEIVHRPPVLQPTTHLHGHRNAIGLILSNGEGTLVSFDDSSTIMVWDVVNHKFEREIHAHEHLGFIFSMNVHHRSIVTGGRNGKIIVWSADTGDALLSVDIPSKYLEHLNVFNLLNVAIWEDLVAYGLYDGSFYVYDMKKQTQLYNFNTADAITVDDNMDNNNEDETADTALAPMTLAINGHIILTNGPRNDQLAAWDATNGNFLYTLSESNALLKHPTLAFTNPANHNNNTDNNNTTLPVPSRELKFAEISRDASLIFGSVAYEGQLNMLGWDFRGDKSHTRRVEKRRVMGEGPTKILDLNQGAIVNGSSVGKDFNSQRCACPTMTIRPNSPVDDDEVEYVPNQ
ncbi:hypothetical protein SmJEL517_g06238 [Synchytrium microbalum]|uniref:F-box domain-containing protein n=1 Tax=Synchytrium microbalum TaxID=1806994 RepID=A0A507BJF0_9FUNG|nr:uncharacterized protein SmJEL517_g06238 [Synchytrium microbalum]TPX30127.1 hypothetical protein SmJEL517_g06238 [Synchytrium microbalum]